MKKPVPKNRAVASTQALESRLRLVTSRQNALVKELRAALEKAELTADGHLAIEGARLVEEAIRSGLHFKALFFSESAKARAGRLLPQISKHADVILLPDAVFASAVATEGPQGVAALVKLRQPAGTELQKALAKKKEPLVVVAAGIQDPGNLGAIIRSAEAFGASALLTTEGTVSQFNPKAVRGSAGSLFRMPVVRMEAERAITEMRAGGLRLLGTSSHRGTPLPSASLLGPLALFIGSEGAGLPRKLLQAMDEVVEIPLARQVESLNVSVAASIVLYEAARQKAQAAL